MQLKPANDNVDFNDIAALLAYLRSKKRKAT